MLLSRVSENTWTLSVGDLPFVCHTPGAPFAVALRREKTYESDRGTVKEHVVEAERIPLATVSETTDGVILSGGGHTLRVGIIPCDGGAELLFTGEAGWAYAFALASLDGEAVFGGGEQYRQTNLRGERVVNFVSEHIKAATILEKALLPRCLYKEKPHSAIGSYAPMPVFVTDEGRLFLFDTEADGVSRFLDDGYAFTFDSCPRKLTLLAGESYEALALLLAERIPNRQHIPQWCREGMILSIQGGSETILTKTFTMLDAGAKISGVWSQDWSGENRTVMGKQVWWNWEADEKLYPDLKGAIAKLNARGVRFLGYINPYLVKDSRLYNYCKEQKLLITKADGSIYHIKSTTFDAGMLDLTDPAAVRFVKDVLIKRNMLDLGMSGWMADFGEYLPVAVVMFFATRLGNRFGRREVCAYGVLLAAAFYLVLFVLAIFGVTNVWLYLLACLMSGIGTAFIFLLVWVLATDAIDYNKVTYGLNDEATSYAFYSFMRKLGQTVATILINVPLLVIGYNGSELKTEGLTPERLHTMYNFSVMIPAVLFLLVFLILRFVYPLSKKRVEELQAQKEQMFKAQAETK